MREDGPLVEFLASLPLLNGTTPDQSMTRKSLIDIRFGVEVDKVLFIRWIF